MPVAARITRASGRSGSSLTGFSVTSFSVTSFSPIGALIIESCLGAAAGLTGRGSFREAFATGASSLLTATEPITGVRAAGAVTVDAAGVAGRVTVCAAGAATISVGFETCAGAAFALAGAGTAVAGATAMCVPGNCCGSELTAGVFTPTGNAASALCTTGCITGWLTVGVANGAESTTGSLLPA